MTVIVKSLMIILFAMVVSLFAVTVTTNYRTEFDVTTGKETTVEYQSTFELVNGGLVHYDHGVTSVYVCYGNSTVYMIGNYKMIVMIVCNDEGDHYKYIFDEANKRIYATTANGKNVVRFGIERICG